MSEQPQRRPPVPAHRGEPPYLFASYAHADADWVYPLLQLLHEAGVPIWYDEGIEGRASWTDSIATALEQASGVLLFASPPALASRNVTNEVHFALDSDVPVLTIAREAPELPPGLRLALGREQAVVRSDLSRSSFETKLLVAARRMMGEDADSDPALMVTGSSLNERTTLAVLPFRGSAGDDDYFTTGLVEEITYTLQRLQTFSVIAPESSMQYAADADPRKVAQDLGADFVVTGSVRRGGAQLRIDARLVDPRTGSQLWSERFSGVDEDLFALQDQVAEGLVAAIEPEIFQHEARRTTRVPTEDLTAWDLHLQAQAAFARMSLEGHMQARDLWRRALELDSDFVQALAGFAGVGIHMMLTWRGTISDEEAEQAKHDAQEYASRAVALDPDYPPGQLALSGAYLLQSRYEEALRVARRAAELCPGSVPVRSGLALALFRAGELRAAIAEHEAAIRLSPRDPRLADRMNGLASCYFFLGEFAEALEYAQRGVELQGNLIWPLLFRILSLGQLGRIDEAKAFLAQLPEHAPEFSGAQLRDLDPAVGNIFIEGLQALGWDG